jgi:hypothetical protein
MPVTKSINEPDLDMNTSFILRMSSFGRENRENTDLLNNLRVQ